MRLSRLIPVVAIVAACGGGGNGGGVTPPPNQPQPPSMTATVTMGAASFSPSVTPLLVGGTVTWNNNSGVLHNVTFASAAGAPANIPAHEAGSNQRTFNTIGPFHYECTLHPGMAGRIEVQ